MLPEFLFFHNKAIHLAILNSWSSGFNIRLPLGNSFSNTKLMI